MRTIGKMRINKVKQIVIDTIKENNEEFEGILYKIRARIPKEYYDIWEGAYSEIEMVINDTILGYKYYK